MRLKTFLITLNWFANETVYLGLSYYSPSLGSNPPLSFFLSSLVELPSYAFCWFVMDRYGRRWPMCLLMILGGISCVITVLLPEGSETETLVLYLISKSMICGSFLIIYPFAGELYPTQARGVGIGFSSYVGGLGLIIIPFITYLGKENLRLPLGEFNTQQQLSFPPFHLPFSHFSSHYGRCYYCRGIYWIKTPRNFTPPTATNSRRRRRIWQRLEHVGLYALHSTRASSVIVKWFL